LLVAIESKSSEIWNQLCDCHDGWQSKKVTDLLWKQSCIGESAIFPTLGGHWVAISQSYLSHSCAPIELPSLPSSLLIDIDKKDMDRKIFRALSARFEDWNEIAERCDLIASKAPLNEKHARLLFNYIDELIHEELLTIDTLDDEVKDRILSTKWIPVRLMAPTVDTSSQPLPRVDEEKKGRELLVSPFRVRLFETRFLTSASYHIVGIGNRLGYRSNESSKWLDTLFGWSTVTIDDVIAQLGSLIKLPVSDIDMITDMVKKIYNHLQRLPLDSTTINKLNERSWIWIPSCGGWKHAHDVAMEGPNDGHRLIKIPKEFAAHHTLFTQCGVPSEFSDQSLINALNSFESTVPTNLISFVHDVIERLAKRQEAEVLKLSEGNPCLMLTSTNQLVESSSVLCNDTPWLPLPSDNKEYLVHDRIPRQYALTLGCQSRYVSIQRSKECQSISIACDAAGQKVSLVDVLKGIAQDYRGGVSLPKEMMQNADDAGATHVEFILSEQQFGTESVLTHEMKAYQGTALYVYNNAKFEDRDWKGIQSPHRSSKANGNGIAAGRFGVGFNSCYYYTDLPSILSHDRLLILDPHQESLVPDSNGDRASGVMINFVKDPLLESKLPDQFAPYKLKDCDMKRPFDGTLFRFPLRTHKSRLSEETPSSHVIREVFDEFKKECHSHLLFMRHVREISFSSITAHGKITKLFHVEVDNDDGAAFRTMLDSSSSRPTMVTSMNAKKESKQTANESSSTTATSSAPLPLCMKVRTILTVNDYKMVQCHLVVAGSIPTPQLQSFYYKHLSILHALSPSAAIAILFDTTNGLVDSSIASTSSSSSPAAHLFNRLMLPISSPIKDMHMDARFEVTRSRRALETADHAKGDAAIKGKWNEYVFSGSIAPLMVHLLTWLTRNQHEWNNDQLVRFYAFWPWSNVGSSPNTIHLQSLFPLLVDQPVIRSDTNGGTWISPNTTIFPGDASPEVQNAMRLYNVPLISADVDAKDIDRLVRHFRSTNTLTPTYVLNTIRQAHSSIPPTPAGKKKKLTKSAPRLTREATVRVLRFVCETATNGVTATDFIGCPLLPMLHGMISIGDAKQLPIYIMSDEEYHSHTDLFRPHGSRIVDGVICDGPLLKQLSSRLCSTKETNVHLMTIQDGIALLQDKSVEWDVNRFWEWFWHHAGTSSAKPGRGKMITEDECVELMETLLVIPLTGSLSYGSLTNPCVIWPYQGLAPEWRLLLGQLGCHWVNTEAKGYHHIQRLMKRHRYGDQLHCICRMLQTVDDLVKRVANISTKAKQLLRSQLGHLKVDTKEEVNLEMLKDLPIYETCKEDGKSKLFSSITNLLEEHKEVYYYNGHGFPLDSFSLVPQVLRLGTREPTQLYSLLKVPVLTTQQLFMKALPQLNQHPEKRVTIMEQALLHVPLTDQRFQSSDDKAFIAALKELPFLHDCKGMLHKPSVLFFGSDILKPLLEPTQFICAPFTDYKYREALSRLGVQLDLTAHAIDAIITRASSKECPRQLCIDLLDYLCSLTQAPRVLPSKLQEAWLPTLQRDDLKAVGIDMASLLVVANQKSTSTTTYLGCDINLVSTIGPILRPPKHTLPQWLKDALAFATPNCEIVIHHVRNLNNLLQDKIRRDDAIQYCSGTNRIKSILDFFNQQLRMQPNDAAVVDH
jgi:hypothetical protein